MAHGPTMRLHECAEAFRANQIAMSEDILAQGICENKFGDFAIGIQSKERKLLIFRDSFYEWLGKMLKREPIRVDENIS